MMKSMTNLKKATRAAESIGFYYGGDSIDLTEMLELDFFDVLTPEQRIAYTQQRDAATMVAKQAAKLAHALRGYRNAVNYTDQIGG